MATLKPMMIDATAITLTGEWLRPLNQMRMATYVEALAHGATLPPIQVEAGSLRLLDGLHRLRAWQKQAGKDEIPVRAFLQECATEADALLIAAAGNVTHGDRWTSTDVIRLIHIAERERIDPAVFCRTVQISETRYRELAPRKWIDGASGRAIPIKTGLAHLQPFEPTAAMLQVNRIAGLSVVRQGRDILRHLQAGT